MTWWHLWETVFHKYWRWFDDIVMRRSYHHAKMTKDTYISGVSYVLHNPLSGKDRLILNTWFTQILLIINRSQLPLIPLVNYLLKVNYMWHKLVSYCDIPYSSWQQIPKLRNLDDVLALWCFLQVPLLCLFFMNEILQTMIYYSL